jgi:prepilin-type N-terminal cleavage/methylation domain-containing protein
MQINKSRKSGFTLVEIMIVVAIIGLLAAIAIPNFVKARTASQKSACIANLKQIDGAKATWALETKKTASATPGTTDLFGSTNYIAVEPSCPASGSVYTMTAVDTKTACPTLPAEHAY